VKKTIVALSIALPTSVFAGGFERDPQTPNYIFNDGRYMEFKLTVSNPDVDGNVPLGTVTQSSEDVASNYRSLGFAYKAQINDKMDWSLAYLEPYGADINYANADALYPYGDSWAKLDVQGLTAMLKYKIGDRVSVYGGAKLSSFDADANVVVTIPTPGTGAPLNVLNYQVNAEEDRSTGYVVGAAYEMKEIAMRVALTYNTAIDHESSVVESATAVDLSTGAPIAVVVPDTSSTVDTTLPATLNLSLTYRLGLGRRISDDVALAVILGHEKSNGEQSTNLAPTDGYDSLTFAGTFTEGNTKVTAGISFVDIGDTDTNAVVGESDFSSNKAVGFGLTFGYTF